MDKLFNTFVKSKNLEAFFNALSSSDIKDYYALFIASMAYYKYLTVSASFASTLYVTIINMPSKTAEALSDKIFNFLINKAIDDIEVEINEPENNES